MPVVASLPVESQTRQVQMRFVLKQGKQKHSSMRRKTSYLYMQGRKRRASIYYSFVLPLRPPPCPENTICAHIHEERTETSHFDCEFRTRPCILNPRRQATRLSMGHGSHQSGTGISASVQQRRWFISRGRKSIRAGSMRGWSAEIIS